MQTAPHEGCAADGEPDPVYAEDPVFVEQVRQVLRSYLEQGARGPLDARSRQQVQGWTASVLAAGEELVAMGVAASLTDDRGVVLARLDSITCLLTDLGEQAARLRSVLATPPPGLPT
ncbi:MAG TPA: hypothetical protein VFP72_14055 [Kineosporiaceae bacterium]|nr:hypothetical protein [Kineosporiaceae bacterium]